MTCIIATIPRECHTLAEVLLQLCLDLSVRVRVYELPQIATATLDPSAEILSNRTRG